MHKVIVMGVEMDEDEVEAIAEMTSSNGWELYCQLIRERLKQDYELLMESGNEEDFRNQQGAYKVARVIMETPEYCEQALRELAEETKYVDK